MRSWSAAGSAALPDTSSRAEPTACASSVDASRSAASRWYIVGTPNSIVAGPASAFPAASEEKRPRWYAAPPRRSGPSTPRISPCTWNSGSPCATTSSPVQSHASASASRFEAIARRGSTTPFGGPVVPEV